MYLHYKWTSTNIFDLSQATLRTQNCSVLCTGKERPEAFVTFTELCTEQPLSTSGWCWISKLYWFFTCVTFMCWINCNKTLLTSIKSQQQKIWPNLAPSPLQLCMRASLLPGVRGMLQRGGVHLRLSAPHSWSYSWSPLIYMLTQSLQVTPLAEIFFLYSAIFL